MSDKKKTLYLCHGMYGCETGCCGYRLCEDDEGDEVVGRFVFHHIGDDEDPADFALQHWRDELAQYGDDYEVLPGAWFRCS